MEIYLKLKAGIIVIVSKLTCFTSQIFTYNMVRHRLHGICENAGKQWKDKGKE